MSDYLKGDHVEWSSHGSKTEGTVRNVLTGVESSLPDEDIQICVNAPVGDCVVDL